VLKRLREMVVAIQSSQLQPEAVEN
jgi:hypothetical protein